MAGEIIVFITVDSRMRRFGSEYESKGRLTKTHFITNDGCKFSRRTGKIVRRSPETDMRWRLTERSLAEIRFEYLKPQVIQK